MKLKTIVTLSVCIHLSICSSVNAQESVTCLEKDAVSTAKTPLDLWRSLIACVAEDKHEQAVFMYGLAGSLGIYDSMRIKDRSAYQAAKILPIVGQSAMGEEKSLLFQQKVRERFGDESNRSKLCAAYKGMPPPTYFPTYMVNHGLAYLSDSEATPLVSDFNESEAWPKAVEAYMQCPNGFLNNQKDH